MLGAELLPAFPSRNYLKISRLNGINPPYRRHKDNQFPWTGSERLTLGGPAQATDCSRRTFLSLASMGVLIATAAAVGMCVGASPIQRPGVPPAAQRSDTWLIRERLIPNLSW